jgi:hypothetical protein
MMCSRHAGCASQPHGHGTRLGKENQGKASRHPSDPSDPTVVSLWHSPVPSRPRGPVVGSFGTAWYSSIDCGAGNQGTVRNPTLVDHQCWLLMRHAKAGGRMAARCLPPRLLPADHAPRAWMETAPRPELRRWDSRPSTSSLGSSRLSASNSPSHPRRARPSLMCLFALCAVHHSV